LRIVNEADWVLLDLFRTATFAERSLATPVFPIVKLLEASLLEDLRIVSEADVALVEDLRIVNDEETVLVAVLRIVNEANAALEDVF
jgi:hypothetical protein